MTILPLLVKASTQSHDEDRLRAELEAGIKDLFDRLPREPTLSPRQRRSNIDALIDAIAEVFAWSGHGLSAELTLPPEMPPF